MWKRRSILNTFVFISVVFVGVQIFLFTVYIDYKSLVKNVKYDIPTELKSAKLQLHADAKPTQFEFADEGYTSAKSPILLLDVVKNFTDISQKYGIDIIFLPLSQHVQVRGSDHSHQLCTMFCDSKHLPFIFMVPYHPPQVTPAFVYRQSGFQVNEIKSPLPVTYKGRTNVTTHVLLSHHKLGTVFLMHLIFLYTFIGDFRWFGSAVTDGRVRYRGLSWSLPGVIKKIDTAPTTIDGITIQLPTQVEALRSSLANSRYIECNHTRAALFHSLHPEAATKDDYAFISRARDIIHRATLVFHRLNLPYWLSSGTCLGWFRQCSIIPYSVDVDFGVRIDDYDDRIVPAFQNAGFRLKLIFGKKNDSYELSFYRDGIKVDIFFFYEESDHVWNGGTQHDDGKKYKYKFPKFSICWSSLLGVVVRVPCQTESYVVANYGPDWFTPVTTWSWKASASNVEENGKWQDHELDEVVQIFDVESPNEIVIDLHRQH